MNSCILAFNGERRDPIGDEYHLGNGYRAYNPPLRRFHAPDSFSPFGAGGVNPYVYCNGDPINRSDPSGHFSWRVPLGIGLGILGVLGAVFTGGSSLVAAGGISAALLSTSLESLMVGSAALVADVTGLASMVLEKHHPQASAVLGWVSFASGLLSFGSALAGGITRLATPLKKTVWGWDSIHGVQVMAESGDNANRPVTLFADMHYGLRRLNVLAHSRYAAGDFSATILLRNGQAIDGYGLAQRVMHHVDISQYGCARMVVCHSADGLVSLADQFRESTGLITTGFRGNVTCYGELPDDIRDIWHVQRATQHGQVTAEDLQFISGLVQNRANMYRNMLRVFPRLDEEARAYFRIGNGLFDNYQPVTYFSHEEGSMQLNAELGGYTV
ncbi:RHS repeat-associated core domain-containing protein [Winslowiella iniecta]|uniref:RHS repeat-associated core domain-containing protein n=1 Tax=Winslowiella iniecta TaxID=1560201 RepID=A0A0L7SVX3_9GAMM|nr:RHS repeat-associated core domain-containing protein [Winslowiella iniecta]KOC87297.1 hypothetical protein NG42_21200 [Winslowiella iniecta]KOC93982.1 hypothetical protein NG43_07155 [Winslowiella iniecta]